MPAQDGTLVGHKIEIRVQLERDVVDAASGETTAEAFLHCFEGTVRAVRTNESGSVRSMLGTRTKWSVATVEWDAEFLAWGSTSHNALDPSLYGNEKKNGGWNILNQDYITAYSCAADRFEELAQQFKEKAHSGALDLCEAASALGE